MLARPSTALLLLTVLACQPPTPQFTPQDETAVREVENAALEHIRTGDWGAWAGVFSEDAVLQPPNGPAVTSRAAIEAWGRAFPPIESVTSSNLQIHGDANLAWATLDYELKIKDMPSDHGKELIVYRRGAAGKWEVVAGSFNSDLPLPTPPAK